MIESKHLSLDGEILPITTAVISRYNKGFLYCECFSFEIRGCNSQLFFPENSFNYLLKKAADFNFMMPDYYSQKIFEHNIFLLLRKNRIYKGFVGIISVFRSEKDEIQILITVEHCNKELYDFNKEGSLISLVKNPKIPNLFLETKKIPFLNLNFYFEKFINSQDRYSDFILLDDDENIVRTINSCIFFTKNDVLYYSHRNIDDINNYLNTFLLTFFEQLGFTIEQKNIKSSEIKQSNFDEILLFDIKNGFRWVMGYENDTEITRYYNKISRLLSTEINLYLKQKINYEDRKNE